MNWPRAMVVWLVIVLVESIHGIVRQLFIAPVIGDLPARQLGVPVGSLLVLLIAWVFIRWLGAASVWRQLEIGALWVVLTVAFELGLGAVLGYSLERLLADYDVREGGLMGFGLLVMLFAPVLTAKLRAPRPAGPERP